MKTPSSTLAALSLIALFSLTGCSSTNTGNPTTASPKELSAEPVVHQGLTPEENKRLDAQEIQTRIGDEIITSLTPDITEVQRTRDNGETYTASHIRIAIDTSGMSYECENEKYQLNGTIDESGTRNAEGFTEGDCTPRTAFYAKTGRTTGSTEDLSSTQGRNVYEFESEGTELIVGAIENQQESIVFNARTGEIIEEEAYSAEQELYPYVLPGTTPGNKDTSIPAPQYQNGDQTIAIGKATVTKGDHNRSVLSIPIQNHLPKALCKDLFTTEDLNGCISISITTSKTGSNEVNETLPSFQIPATYSGTIRVSSPEFDKADLTITSWGDKGPKPQMVINLLTGEVARNQP